MENISSLTLGEIVKQNFRAAAVFEKFSLDFCCMGNQKLQDACQASNIEPAVVIAELENVRIAESDGVDFDLWPLDLLIDYIYQRHHVYVEEKTPLIKTYLDKICRVHGERHPELLEIRKLFLEIGGELAVHMKKEELLLFPYIKKLQQAEIFKISVSSPLFGSVNNPVNAMKEDHTIEGEKFKNLASLANNYQLPPDACSTFSAAYQLLEEYQKDLHMHIHLENNILFSKAIRLEEKVNSNMN